jgi:HSP20 family protein
MSLIKWSPNWDPFSDMESMMNRLPMRNPNMHGGFSLPLDMYEEKGNIVVKAPLAEINPEDIQVSVEKNILTIQGETKKEHEVDDKNYYRKEVRSGSFFRQIGLPTAVQEDKIEGRVEEGVLLITLPKATETETKKIEVKVIKKKK